MAPRGVVAAVTISVLSMKYLLIVPCLRRRAPHHCGDLDPFRTIGLMSLVFSSPLALSASGESINMVLFSIPRQALGLRPSDQSCHHETWLHLHFVDWNNEWNHQAHYNGNIRNISEVLSDSFSSWVRNHLRSLVLAISLAQHHEVTWWAQMSWPDCHRWGKLWFHPLLCLSVMFHHDHHAHLVQKKHQKDVESVRSGQLFHVPIQPALFPLPREPGGLLSRD